MVLYRKFRPTTFAEIKEQTVVTDILRAVIAKQKISHAYLFTGTRGVGKTTAARVFAKAVNCLDPVSGEPCNTCESCRSFLEGTNIDLVEIDAASNRGIDDIRDIKEKVNFAPTMSKYKVYIIDEVHMLTKDAFNALLKTLEEPPAQVIFILATTEIHKVPLTIISRCQRFDFKNASISQLKALISDVCAKENIIIDDGSIQLVAELAEGSFRDGLSILEKLRSLQKKAITADDTMQILGIPDRKVIILLLRAILSGDITNALDTFKEAVDGGMDVYQLNKHMLGYLENLLLLKAHKEKSTEIDLSVEKIVTLLNEFIKVDERMRYTSLPRVVLETAIVGLIDTKQEAKIYHEYVAEGKKKEKASVVEKLPEKSIEKAPEKLPEKLPEKIIEKPSEKPVDKTEKKQPPAEASESLALDKADQILAHITMSWGKVIKTIMPFNHHLGSFLSKAKPVRITEKSLVMEVKYKFHKDSIEQLKSRDAFADAIEAICNYRLYPECDVNASLVIAQTKVVQQKENVIEKKQEITDNRGSNIASSEEDLLEEAMKLFS